MATKQGFYSRVHLYDDLTISVIHFHCFQLPPTLAQFAIEFHNILPTTICGRQKKSKSGIIVLYTLLTSIAVSWKKMDTVNCIL